LASETIVLTDVGPGGPSPEQVGGAGLAYLAPQILVRQNGVLKSRRGKILNFTGGATVTDDPATESAQINIVAGGGEIVLQVFTADGSAIVAGAIADLYMSFAADIESVTMLADQSGSAVVDIWKVPYATYPATSANSICGSNKPTLSSAAKSQDTVLAGWSTLSVLQGDCIRFHVDSATTITRLCMVLGYSFPTD
jgi:hypothetical protein